MNSIGPASESTKSAVLDVVLIGGGIMSTTLGALISKLQPDWSVTLFERMEELASESSNAWNNAGTGHSGFCELNYMADTADATKPLHIARQFHLSRQLWAALVTSGDLREPSHFVNPAPHMDIVFGARDVSYLRQRYGTLRAIPMFSAMEFTDDPNVIADWAPLLMDGRSTQEPIAATRYAAGTDVDFGSLTVSLAQTMATSGAVLKMRHEVTSLRRDADGLWSVSGRDRQTKQRFSVRTRFVFVGAGGYALKLLQKAKLPEVRGYAVFPFGAQFLRTDNPAVVERHRAKVYSQAALGAPPMSVPHLDQRVVDGQTSLMFGPYATFSTKLLRYGRLIDLFTTLRLHNLKVLVAAGVQNLSLVTFLIKELLSTRRRKFAQLQRFYPAAHMADWYPIQAGQRAQLVKPDPQRVGILTFGTELVTGAEGTIAGLLGASPGASTAPAIMVDLLRRCFPKDYGRWLPMLTALMPGVQTPVDNDQATLDASLRETADILELS
ncbi:MAG: malate dehydrogenase (quinone) [Gordonia sp. (in: high G+C Gram-positive bacteria)]|uniref:malate dehydrogenase (quinone) n=1 Tax=Gordonia sp. (in: high G+C Gram-positive bacteria) TaxID=84139 RepID=UPI003BB643CC